RLSAHRLASRRTGGVRRRHLRAGECRRVGAGLGRTSLRRVGRRAMERVVILGAAGAGKSELAARVARRTGLPLVHLDLLFWRPSWTPAPPDEAHAELAAAIEGERWILDGNFLGAAGVEDARFERADTVIFLD